MKMQQLLNRAAGLTVTAIAVTAATSLPVLAADGDIDFSTMIAAVSGATVIAAFLGMGVVKLGPNFAKWAINKVASFFPG
ncbi:hypothetical protein [Pseudomonas sp.]|uniref:hypothetical protein n=1 Tax=Pseudomonas sp. TaxID=306 RepID=UPI00273231D2|nr:hypothetical protein [Pseudomonas sp.]MDP2748636.1 hypothetical protein [Pseudomonas sp.]